MEKYILQKDLPDVKAGAEGVINEIGVLCFYESLGTPEYFFPKGSYENKPEWFKLKEEKITIDAIVGNENIIEPINKWGYHFLASGKIIEDKYPAIVKSIEFIINDNDDITYSTLAEKFKARFGIGERLRTYKISFEEIDEFFKAIEDYKYTEEDMRKCFYAPIHIDGGGRADTFEDYINSLNK